MFENVNNKQLGKVLKFIRESKNFSLEVVALQSGYSSKSSLCKIESGVLSTRFEKLQKICHALGCDTALVIAFAQSNIKLQFSIQSWEDFFTSVAQMEHAHQNKLLDFIKDIFPKKYIEVKQRLET